MAESCPGIALSIRVVDSVSLWCYFGLLYDFTHREAPCTPDCDPVDVADARTAVLIELSVLNIFKHGESLVDLSPCRPKLKGNRDSSYSIIGVDFDALGE